MPIETSAVLTRIKGVSAVIYGYEQDMTLRTRATLGVLVVTTRTTLGTITTMVTPTTTTSTTRTTLCRA